MAPSPQHRTSDQQGSDDVDRRTQDLERAALHKELARLRDLIGPDEKSYAQLSIEVLETRDHAIGSEAELGELRWRVGELKKQLKAVEKALRTAMRLSDERHHWITESQPVIARLEQARDELSHRLTDQQDQYATELESIYRSRAWRIGRLISAPFSTLRGVLKQR